MSIFLRKRGSRARGLHLVSLLRNYNHITLGWLGGDVNKSVHLLADSFTPQVSIQFTLTQHKILSRVRGHHPIPRLVMLSNGFLMTVLNKRELHFYAALRSICLTTGSLKGMGELWAVRWHLVGIGISR